MLNPDIQIKDYKIGTTRNGSRIWLDTVLNNRSNWQFGCRYDRTIDDMGVITLTPNEGGKYKVSGKQGRPVIDLCGKWVTVAMTDLHDRPADRCTVVVATHGIVIQPAPTQD